MVSPLEGRGYANEGVGFAHFPHNVLFRKSRFLCFCVDFVCICAAAFGQAEGDVGVGSQIKVYQSVFEFRKK